MAARRATHSGSWYSDSIRELGKQLDSWLNAAELTHGPARAIIAPHAGYQYCGACSAFAYRQISPVVVNVFGDCHHIHNVGWMNMVGITENVSASQRVFILGPSHHVRLAGCALSSAVKYRTPLYDLRIDTQVYADLDATGQFERMSLDVDEDEHSIEMHLPFIAKVMEDYKDSFTIVPVLVGSLTPDREAVYGRIFAKYLADPQNLFIISSDFCHWGHRFRYTYYDRSWGDIYQSITKLDRLAMDLIETLNPTAFTDYLKKYANTICGRHPIGVLLQAVSYLQKAGTNGHKMHMKFLKYAQSSQCTNMNDSSVSYAAAALTFE